MPRYEVYSLDVWGNAVDGYEINNQFKEGSIMLPPDATDAQTIQALISNGHLNNAAAGALEAGDLAIDDRGMGELIEITETDPVFAAVSPDGEERFIDAPNRRAAEEELEDGEELENRDNMRPILILQIMEGDPGAQPFLRRLIRKPREGQDKVPVIVELRAVPGKMSKHDLEIESHINGDYFATLDLLDLEQTQSPEHLRSPVVELGLAPDGETIYPWEGLYSDAKVAMDAFLERGGKGLDAFVLIPEVEEFVNELHKNTDDFFAGKITYEKHGERNRNTWDRAKASGFYELVTDRLRERPMRNPVRELDDEDEIYQPPDVARALQERGLRVVPCGLNADWSVSAWQLSRGRPNMVDGAYFLLDTEDGENNFAVVQRFNEEIEVDGRWVTNPLYDEDIQGIMTVIEDAPLNEVLDEYIRRRDLGEFEPYAPRGT